MGMTGSSDTAWAWIVDCNSSKAACENWANEYNNFYALGKFGQDRKTFSKVLLYHLTNLVLVSRPRGTDT